MSVIVVLLSVSVLIAALFLFAFIWNVKSGQYEDDFSPPYRMLFDDENRDDEYPQMTKKPEK